MKPGYSGAEVSRRVPRTVWALGLVSMFMDLSSEIIHALLPLFLTTTLGVSVVMVGLIDGIAEATASISKVFSGYISDHIGRRRLYLAGCHARKPHRLDHLPDWRACKSSCRPSCLTKLSRSPCASHRR